MNEQQSSEPQCSHCGVDFGVLTWRHRCAVCGETLCSSCSPHAVVRSKIKALTKHATFPHINSGSNPSLQSSRNDVVVLSKYKDFRAEGMTATEARKQATLSDSLELEGGYQNGATRKTANSETSSKDGKAGSNGSVTTTSSSSISSSTTHSGNSSNGPPAATSSNDRVTEAGNDTGDQEDDDDALLDNFSARLTAFGLSFTSPSKSALDKQADTDDATSCDISAGDSTNADQDLSQAKHTTLSASSLNSPPASSNLLRASSTPMRSSSARVQASGGGYAWLDLQKVVIDVKIGKHKPLLDDDGLASSGTIVFQVDAIVSTREGSSAASRELHKASVWRRFSEFERCHMSLEDDCGDIAFPSKSLLTFGVLDEQGLDKRQRDLDKFVRALMSRMDLLSPAKRGVVFAFLGLSPLGGNLQPDGSALLKSLSLGSILGSPSAPTAEAGGPEGRGGDGAGGGDEKGPLYGRSEDRAGGSAGAKAEPRASRGGGGGAGQQPEERQPSPGMFDRLGSILSADSDDAAGDVEGEPGRASPGGGRSSLFGDFFGDSQEEQQQQRESEGGASASEQRDSMFDFEPMESFGSLFGTADDSAVGADEGGASAGSNNGGSGGCQRGSDDGQQQGKNGNSNSDLLRLCTRCFACIHRGRLANFQVNYKKSVRLWLVIFVDHWRDFTAYARVAQRGLREAQAHLKQERSAKLILMGQCVLMVARRFSHVRRRMILLTLMQVLSTWKRNAISEAREQAFRLSRQKSMGGSAEAGAANGSCSGDGGGVDGASSGASGGDGTGGGAFAGVRAQTPRGRAASRGGLSVDATFGRHQSMRSRSPPGRMSMTAKKKRGGTQGQAFRSVSPPPTSRGGGRGAGGHFEERATSPRLMSRSLLSQLGQFGFNEGDSQVAADTVWINKMMEVWWPFLKEAMNAKILAKVNPMLASQKPSFVTSVALSRMDFGSMHPLVTAVDVIHAGTGTPKNSSQRTPGKNGKGKKEAFERFDEKEEKKVHPQQLVLDLSIEFNAGNDQIAELSMCTELGLQTSVSVTDLTLNDLIIRIVLKPLLPTIPCFGGIQLCFMRKPEIEFDLTAAGLAITSLPFVSDWLQSFIKDSLLKELLFPKFKKVEIAPAPANGAARSVGNEAEAGGAVGVGAGQNGACALPMGTLVVRVKAGAKLGLVEVSGGCGGGGGGGGESPLSSSAVRNTKVETGKQGQQAEDLAKQSKVEEQAATEKQKQEQAKKTEAARKAKLQKQKMLTVRVPPGTAAGEEIVVATPEGREISVIVPATVNGKPIRAGSKFSIPLPAEDGAGEGAEDSADTMKPDKEEDSIWNIVSEAADSFAGNLMADVANVMEEYNNEDKDTAGSTSASSDPLSSTSSISGSSSSSSSNDDTNSCSSSSSSNLSRASSSALENAAINSESAATTDAPSFVLQYPQPGSSRFCVVTLLQHSAVEKRHQGNSRQQEEEHQEKQQPAEQSAEQQQPEQKQAESEAAQHASTTSQKKDGPLSRKPSLGSADSSRGPTMNGATTPAAFVDADVGGAAKARAMNSNGKATTEHANGLTNQSTGSSDLQAASTTSHGDNKAAASVGGDGAENRSGAAGGSGSSMPGASGVSGQTPAATAVTGSVGACADCEWNQTVELPYPCLNASNDGSECKTSQPMVLHFQVLELAPQEEEQAALPPVRSFTNLSSMGTSAPIVDQKNADMSQNQQLRVRVVGCADLPVASLVPHKPTTHQLHLYCDQQPLDAASRIVQQTGTLTIELEFANIAA